jgi:hypothetical protein
MSTIKTQFDLHTRLFNNVLDKISDTESNNRANETVNHIKWLAGHLTSARMGMGKFSGLEADKSYDEFFGHGKGINPSLNYPNLEDIKNKWNEVSDKISAGLSNIPAEVLNTETPMKVPVADTSVKGFIGFMMHIIWDKWVF